MSFATVAVVVVTLAAAGYSAYAANEAAKNTEDMANYNAAMQRQNNELNFRIATQNNDYQRKLLEIQAAQSRNDATMVDQQVVTSFDQAREEIRRSRQEKEQLLARQRAGFAAAGVLSAGSPVEVLAETAGIYEMQAADTMYKNELQSRELAYRADVLRQGGNVEDYKQNLLNLDQYGAKTAKRLGMAQTELNRLSGMNQAEGMQRQAVGTLLSGAASATTGGIQTAK